MAGWAEGVSLWSNRGLAGGLGLGCLACPSPPLPCNTATTQRNTNTNTNTNQRTNYGTSTSTAQHNTAQCTATRHATTQCNETQHRHTAPPPPCRPPQLLWVSGCARELGGGGVGMGVCPVLTAPEAPSPKVQWLTCQAVSCSTAMDSGGQGCIGREEAFAFSSPGR